MRFIDPVKLVLGRKMIVFTFIDLVQRLPRLLISTTCLVIGMKTFLWYMGAKFAPRREWIYFPISLLLGISSSTLLAVLYCKLNPMVNEFLLDKPLASLTRIDHIFFSVPCHHIDWNVHHPVDTTTPPSVIRSLDHQPVGPEVSRLVAILYFYVGGPARLHAGPQQVDLRRFLLH